jgi:tetratricopeptide (TPR) repeat protein
MSRHVRLVRGLTLLAGLAAVLGSGPARSQGAAGEAPSIETTRTGRTPRGATRVVVQTDHPAEHLVVELPGGNGFDVHLLGTSPGRAPTEMVVRDGRVDRVVFRLEATGTVARVLSADSPVRVKSFRLDDPPRVVVDVYPDDRERAPGPEAPSIDPSARESRPASISLSAVRAGEASDATRPPVAEPQLVRKPYRTVQPDPKGEVRVAAAPDDDEGGPASNPDDGSPPDDEAEAAAAEETGSEPTLFEISPTPAMAAESGEGSGDFEDLILWIHALKTRVDALRSVDSEVDRAALRRELAFLLAQRGIYNEAEKALVSSLESPGRDEVTGFSDSLALAEIRLRLGKTDEASEVARSVDPRGRRPSEKHRLARILLECGQAATAVALLEPVVPGLPEPDRSRAHLLLARAKWDQGDPDATLRIVRRLTTTSKTPPDVLSSALILEADCLWVAGRMHDAESHYRRAAGLVLTPEEASWTGLQLGNLARRAGRDDEARRHYRTTHEKWPETFFGAQADWFLRMSEEFERLGGAEVVRNRG